jgi:hypothetical protein
MSWPSQSAFHIGECTDVQERTCLLKYSLLRPFASACCARGHPRLASRRDRVFIHNRLMVLRWSYSTGRHIMERDTDNPTIVHTHSARAL